MSLPADWIDIIFSKLTLTYGREFLSRWEGVNIADVKADWAHELAGFEHWPGAVSHALGHLPPARPPTVLEFRDIARKAPKQDRPALEAPVANPLRVSTELRKLGSLRSLAASGRDLKAWAPQLVLRNQAGYASTPTCLRMAREVCLQLSIEPQ